MRETLFLITMTHTAESCPGNDPEKMSETIESAEKIECSAEELGIKVHFMLDVLLGHTAYALVETDSPEALARFSAGISFPQNCTITPVEHLKDMIERAKEMLSEKK